MPTVPQNIYDDPDFFAGYAKLRENPLSANAVVVDPARDALLPPLAGKRVVDLGCGAGGFCRKAIADGAASVVGVDVSERMLAAAQSEPVNPETERRLRYVCASLDRWDAPAESADVIVSVLALHYLPDVRPVFASVANALAPGGVFVFCVEHPVLTARRAGSGWARGEDNAKLHWPVDDYADEGERVSEWFVPGVRVFHRTLATYLDGVFDPGLAISRIAEPMPDEKAVAARAAFADERRRPAFLFVRAEKG
ncbi:MAG: class I SAM-dependent methyltransferase [Akkermansiaceae bacterium]|nr:class I SAM-dependent methyltransferase [Armatimonadota bacterium]